jgi:chlorobactene glucosyltransferase
VIILLIPLIVFFLVTAANTLWWPAVSRRIATRNCAVSVLIPARNEEKNLGDCLDTAICQGEIVAEILIYNDHSTDRTSAIIEEYARRDQRVRCVTPLPLISGWCGKNFACAQLAQAATGEWILFLDADARLTENAIARMLLEMETRNLTFLSCWPGLVMKSLSERLLMPLLNFAVFSIYPAPLAVMRNDPSLGLAHGACMLFHRRSYEEFGGHAAVRDQLFEDTRLAQLWRASGRSGLGMDGQDVVRVRMYSSFTEIWQGFQKNFFPAFKHNLNYWAFLLMHFVMFFLPFLLLTLVLTGHLSSLSVIASALIVWLTRLMLALRFRHSLLSVLLHPFGECVLILIGLCSWWKCRSGRGVVWKGRQYHPTRARG